jgi:hypothetical protein
MMMMMVMMMIFSPFGHLGLRAPYSGMRDVFTSTVYVFTYTPGIEESKLSILLLGQEALVVNQ